MAKRVSHELTLIAWIEDGGAFSITDIVETSRHHAPSFVRGYIKKGDITHLSAVPASWRFGQAVAMRALAAVRTAGERRGGG